MDNKLLKKINGVINMSFAYLSWLQTEYGYQDIMLTIYPSTYTDENIEKQRTVQGQSARMFTTMYIDDWEERKDSSDIISRISGKIYMSYEQFYQLLIECNLDYCRMLDCMKFCIRHEVGHIIADNKQFAGRTIDEWNKHADSVSSQYNGFPKLRQNASLESRCRWFIRYNFEIPYERAANEAVGITEQDVIDNCKRMCGIL